MGEGKESVQKKREGPMITKKAVLHSPATDVGWVTSVATATMTRALKESIVGPKGRIGGEFTS